MIHGFLETELKKLLSYDLTVSTVNVVLKIIHKWAKQKAEPPRAPPQRVHVADRLLPCPLKSQAGSWHTVLLTSRNQLPISFLKEFQVSCCEVWGPSESGLVPLPGLPSFPTFPFMNHMCYPTCHSTKRAFAQIALSSYLSSPTHLWRSVSNAAVPESLLTLLAFITSSNHWAHMAPVFWCIRDSLGPRLGAWIPWGGMGQFCSWVT